MEEIWKDIDGYEGFYQVSNYGRVRSLDRFVKRLGFPFKVSGKVMRQTKQNGYPHISLTKDGQLKRAKVHRLVALAFIPNPNQKPCINHIDSVRHHNYPSNLEWCTHSENTRHAINAGRITVPFNPDNRILWVCKCCKTEFKAHKGKHGKRIFCSKSCAMKQRRMLEKQNQIL
jgi:hypothetical protein